MMLSLVLLPTRQFSATSSLNFLTLRGCIFHAMLSNTQLLKFPSRNSFLPDFAL